MKTAQHVTIDLFGSKRRVNSIKNVIATIEQQNKLRHTALSSTPNCVVYLYNWGHIIIYSYPKSNMMSVDIFSSLCSIKMEYIKNAILEIFKPERYDSSENIRMVGNV